MAIRNTAAEGERGWTLGFNPGAIEQQEAEGQRQIVENSQLPTDGLTPELAAKHGIEIVGVSRGDPMFTDVKFPEGTKIVRTSHDMWTELMAGDKKIAGIFYKAAYYDRRAFISWEKD